MAARPIASTKGENASSLQREGIDSVQHEGLGRRWQFDIERRQSRDHLNALRRFLRKQVGRPWAEVYSEICNNAPKGSFLGQHLRELVDDEVHVNVTVVREGDKDVMYGRRGWKVYDNDLFVSPEDGLITVKGDGEPRRRFRWRPRKAYEMLKVDDVTSYVKVDGIWYLVDFKAIPPVEVNERPFDVVLKVPVFALGEKKHPSDHAVIRTWGGHIYAAAKRQADSRTVRRIVATLATGEAIFAAAAPAISERRSHLGRPQMMRSFGR